jgi:tRNA1(Val) A37 N6-methylase TrmN6
MSRQLSSTDGIEQIESDIKRVGGRIYEYLQFPDDRTASVDDWMADFGVTGAENPDRLVCNLAAFNRLLKSTLYQIYQEESESLGPLSDTEDIYAELIRARAETDDEAFSENPLDILVERIDAELFAPLLETRKHIRGLETPTDAIGELFDNLVPPEIRRERGQFHTPRHVGEFMAAWSVTAGDDDVLDPGIGAGVLTACMYDEKQAAPEPSKVTEMWGVDVDALAIAMASTGLKLENGDGSPNFHHSDYMDTVVNSSSTRLDQRDPEWIPKVDAIVANPPYSRSHALDGDRTRYNRILDAEAGTSITGQSPLFAYFFAHSEQFLEKGGRLAFITPSRFFDTVYGKRLRAFLLDRFTIQAFVFLDLDTPVFGAADVMPCITLLEKRVNADDHDTAFIQVDEWPDVETLLTVIDGAITGGTEFGFVNRVAQQELLVEHDWQNYVNPKEVNSIPGLTPFGQVADIKRGIATGKNDYFCLNQNEVEEWNLDRSHLAKLIRRTSGFKGLEFTVEHWKSRRETGDEVWLLYCYDGDKKVRNVVDEALQTYLDHGREIGADKSYIADNRDPWYVVDWRPTPDIVATYMSKDGFRFIRNGANIRTLNNLHNITLDGFEDMQIDALLAYLNSSVADEITKRSGRRYARGLHKIEPAELKEVPVIDTRELPEDEVGRLAAAYTDLCESLDGGGDVDDVSSALDDTVRDILGLEQVSGD